MIAPNPALVQLPEMRPRQLEDEVTAFHHRLADLELFTDEGLIHILNTHPREYANVSAMGDDRCEYEWGEGDTTGLSGEQMLHAVKNGRMWLNIRRLERYQPKLWSVVEQLYSELEAGCPGLRTMKHSGNLLVSSPQAFVYYHLDVPQNILWHIRGRKKVWVYPVADPYISRDVLESVVAGRRVEDLPYEASFDDGAMTYEMQPGDVVTWPQNSPHRVDNIDGLNVSLSTEHYTERQLRHVRVCRANALIRTALKIPCKSQRTEGLGYSLKSSAFLGMRAMQKLVSRKEASFKYPLTFRVDLNAPNCMVPLGKQTQA